MEARIAMQTIKKDMGTGLVQLFCTTQQSQIQDAKVESVQRAKDSNSFTYSSHVLIWNNLHILHVSSSFKYLAKDILCNSWIQSTYIQRTLVGFGGSTADEAA